MKEFEMRNVGSHIEVYTAGGGVPIFRGYGAGSHGRAGRRGPRGLMQNLSVHGLKGQIVKCM